MQSSNGLLLPQPERSKPKRHNAKNCSLAIRERIVSALANGDSKRAIARALRVSINTVNAVEEQEWQQVETRKARIAAQAERAATRAAERINDKLNSSDDIPLNILVPVFGVSVDKLALLRGEPSLTIHHEHTLSADDKLIAAMREANERVEKRAKVAVVGAPALPLADASVAEETPAQKEG